MDAPHLPGERLLPHRLPLWAHASCLVVIPPADQLPLGLSPGPSASKAEAIAGATGTDAKIGLGVQDIHEEFLSSGGSQA